MSISDVNPYIVTMPPVQGDLMDKFMRLSGRKKDKGQGGSRSQARVATSSNNDERIEKLEEELKKEKDHFTKRVQDIARSEANKVYNQRLEIEPEDGDDPSDVMMDPLRKPRQAVRESKARELRRKSKEEVDSDLYRERRDGPRQRYDPPSRPNYPGTPWENEE